MATIPNYNNFIQATSGGAGGGYSFAAGCSNYACGTMSTFPTSCTRTDITNQEVGNSQDKTYISLVKRVGKNWKIEMAESSDLQKHLTYIDTLRGDPNVEEAKVMQFTKVAGFTILTDGPKNKGSEPDLIKIL
jgi:hypothetical protein